MTRRAPQGVQANQSASREAPPAAYGAFDVVFCIFFTMELAVRVFAFRMQFFKLGEWWNYFDLVAVTLQIIEEIAIASLGDRSDSVLSDMSGMRVLRILRFVPIVLPLFVSLVPSVVVFLCLIGHGVETLRISSDKSGMMQMRLVWHLRRKNWYIIIGNGVIVIDAIVVCLVLLVSVALLLFGLVGLVSFLDLPHAYALLVCFALQRRNAF